MSSPKTNPQQPASPSPVSAYPPTAATASATASATAGGSGLERLPLEVFTTITDLLTNADIKIFRLTSKCISQRARLRLDRVFLSANPRNVEVFLAIANHDEFRNRVTEIIWDDARLAEHIDDDDYDQGYDLDQPLSNETCPLWYEDRCKPEMETLEYHLGQATDSSAIHAINAQKDAQMSLSDSWEYYWELLEEQEEVLESGSDESAFKYGLPRFPNLQRITITAAAHGFLFYPLYETPMIRAFPKGFRYPIPRGWPMPSANERSSYQLEPWSNEEEKVKWRGFCIVTRELANLPKHANVPELVLNANHLHTGLNARIFEEDSEEYDNLVEVMGRPGFARLDLDLLCEQQVERQWPALGNGILRRALGAAKDLRSVSLRTVTTYVDKQRPLTEEDYIPPPLTFLPVDEWKNLNHFGLSGAFVRQQDLLSLLGALPRTLRSVELSFLTFAQRDSGYQSLVDGMRNTLGWANWPLAERPKVIIRFQFRTVFPRQCFYDVNDAVTKYIHKERDRNPFPHATYDQPEFGAFVMHDAFLPPIRGTNLSERKPSTSWNGQMKESSIFVRRRQDIAR